MDDNIATFHLTDEEWHVIQPLVTPPPSSANRGRPPVDERAVLEGILWKLTTDCPWSDLPDCYPSHQTCYRRYRQWQQVGLLLDIILALYEDLRDRGGFDIKEALADGRLKISAPRDRYRVVFDPALQDTRQYESIRLCLLLLLNELKGNLELLAI